MTDVIYSWLQATGLVLDIIGVLIICVGALISLSLLIYGYLQRHSLHGLYRNCRQSLARSILLGLEFLVAGDIIRSVAGEPTFLSVGILALIVLIRSFLGITFEMEVEGRWPWQKKD